MDVLKAVAATVPVIVITGNVDPESGRSVLAAGAFDYVSKPFDLMYLDTAVATAVTYGRKGRRG
jgi:DNA-binding NtrC family response regulator